MGAWGFGSFDNDDAADWGHDLVDTNDVAFVSDALRASAAAPLDEYIEIDVGSNAIAAAEVVAAASGRSAGRSSYNEDVLEWAASNPAAGVTELRDLATTAVSRVITGESELLELWEEAGSDEWLASVRDLMERLARG